MNLSMDAAANLPEAPRTESPTVLDQPTKLLKLLAKDPPNKVNKKRKSKDDDT